MTHHQRILLCLEAWSILLAFLAGIDALSTPHRRLTPTPPRPLKLESSSSSLAVSASSSMIAPPPPKEKGQEEDNVATPPPADRTTSTANKHDAIVNIVSGVVGSAFGEAVAYPVDCIKTRSQSSSQPVSPVQVLGELIQERGLGGVYAGLPSPLLGTMIIKAFVFGGYEISKLIVRRISSWYHDYSEDGGSRADSISHRPLTFLEGVAASFGAGIFGAIVYCPIDRVKIAMQLVGSDDLLTQTTLKTFFRFISEGSLFVGLLATFAREGPYNACYFTLYERTRDWVVVASTKRKDGTQSGMAWWVTPIVGGLAGAFAWLMTLPMDVAKTRVQAGRSPNFWVALTSALKEGSITYGASAVVVRALLKHGVTFTVYEKLRPKLRAVLQKPQVTFA